MESEENISRFPLFPQSLEIDKERRFPHYAPHDDEYGLFNKDINKETYTTLLMG